MVTTPLSRQQPQRARTSPSSGGAPDVAQLSEILSVEGPRTFTRPIYAGNAIATVESSDTKLVITVRGTAFAKASPQGGMRQSKRSPQPPTLASLALSARRQPGASAPS
jgi:electron transfer flavoprotein alpha subunit